MTIDKRLQALFNEYYKTGKLSLFVKMMQALIAMAGQIEKEEKDAKDDKDAKNDLKRKMYYTAVAYLEHQSPARWIQIIKEIHTPYDNWSTESKNYFQHIVSNIETFDDKRMNGYVRKNQRQKYPFGLQFFKMLLDRGFIRVDETGTYPRYNMIAEFLNNYCRDWDLHETKNHRAQIVRFTSDDIRSYLVSLVTPKRSRFTAIAKAFDVDEIVLAGYEDYKPTGTPTGTRTAA